MYSSRVEYYKQLKDEFQGAVIAYITGDRPGFETRIAQDVIDLFIAQLDKIGPVERIVLYLYTRGGDTSAAWNIVNLLRMYCEDLLVVVPHKAHSAGTIISLGANKIIMTKQATLSPIDPSLNSPMNPIIPNDPAKQTTPVSVEAVKGYIELAKDEFGISDGNALSDVLIKLSEYVHPLVLGQVYRSRAQIKMLAGKLLKNQVADDGKVSRIIDFLCSDSGSHDYTINRREAAEELELNVAKPTSTQYEIIKNLYPLEKKFTLTELEKRNNKELQGFLDKVSQMSVQQVDESFARKPDKDDTYRGLQVYHYEVTKSFRIHVVSEDGIYKIIRLDPNHRVHE